MMAQMVTLSFTPKYLRWTLPSVDLDKSIIDRRGTEVISQIQDNFSLPNIKWDLPCLSLVKSIINERVH